MIREKLLLVLLGFNVSAIGLFLYTHNADPILYLNMLGAVVFGMALMKVES